MTNNTTGNPDGDGPKNTAPLRLCPKSTPRADASPGPARAPDLLQLENPLADVSPQAPTVVVDHSPTETTRISKKEHLISDHPNEAEGDPSTESSNARSQAVVDAKRLNFRRRAGPAPSESEGGQAGEEGGRAHGGITNREFLDTIFRDLPSDEHTLALAIAGDPKGASWFGFDAQEVEARCPPGANNYFNCATFRRTGEGELRALEAQAARYHCFVLDDIGTKTGLDALPAIDPTWMLETSPDNFQIGYRLITPIADPAIVKVAQKKVFGSGIGDKRAGGMGRWVRLPNGINGKPKHRDDAGAPFHCRLATWNPDVSYELADLVERLAPFANDMPMNGERPVGSSATHVGAAHPGIPTDVFTPALAESPVLAALKEARLYKREASVGVHEICCPWHWEHTDPDDDRAWLFELSSDFPLGGYKCHHSHSDKYRLGALLERLNLSRSDFHNKPRIRIVEGELQAMVDAAQVALAGTGEFFQSGGLIVKVAIDKSTGAASLQPQTDADLTLALSSAANWEKCETKGESLRWRRCNPLPNCVRLLTQAQSYAFMPVLKGIARQPMFLADGRSLTQTGYDSASGYFGAFDGSRFARPEPTEANARAALDRLMHLLREFHFATPRDKATALAAIFTAVLRPCLGRAPAFHVRSRPLHGFVDLPGRESSFDGTRARPGGAWNRRRYCGRQRTSAVGDLGRDRQIVQGCLAAVNRGCAGNRTRTRFANSPHGEGRRPRASNGVRFRPIADMAAPSDIRPSRGGNAVSNIIQVTPFMLVPDLELALAFMTGVLGFGVDFQLSDYAYVSREGAGLRMLQAGPGNPFQAGTRRFAYYYDCRDVDALYAELKPKLDQLPPDEIHGPANKPYHQRELLILAPDGNLIAFGQAIRDETDP